MLPGNFTVMTKLQEVTVPGQEIVQHITSYETRVRVTCFSPFVFVRIKQTRYNVLISEL